MAMNLQYTYAVIDLDTGLCRACATRSFEVINDAYILVPTLDDYRGKYYNINGDQMWYWDAEFTQLWEEAPQW
jgi:hypothetical protein